MNKLKQPKPSGGRESFLIFVVAGCGILATLSLNSLTSPVAPEKEDSVLQEAAQPQSDLLKKKVNSGDLD